MFTLVHLDPMMDPRSAHTRSASRRNASMSIRHVGVLSACKSDQSATVLSGSDFAAIAFSFERSSSRGFRLSI